MQTARGESQFSNPILWVLLVATGSCIVIEMNFLNRALDIYNTSVVSPIYYVMFSTIAIIASAILFREWAHLNAQDSVALFCGFFTIVAGVFLLHTFKDLVFSMDDLSKSLVNLKMPKARLNSSCSEAPPMRMSSIVEKEDENMEVLENCEEQIKTDNELRDRKKSNEESQLNNTI